jgi:hypothetical protein
METKPEVQTEQPETVGGISTDILGKFLEFLTLQSIREERQEREKNDRK